MLDLQGICDFTDYFVLMNADSSRQINTLVDQIEAALKLQGVRPHHREGTADSGWVLLDFIEVIVHIFRPEEREY